MSSRYDAIVIGSGLGGLTCGAFLARSGRRVLVLEQHSKIGGYAHSFRRGRFTFESGIHSIPLGTDSLIRHMLKLLGVSERVQEVPLPSMYSYRSPGMDFTVPMRHDDIVAALNERFPHERANIARLLGDMRVFYETLGRPMIEFETNFREEDTSFVSRYHNKSLAEYIAGFTSDPGLQSVFHAMWPYAGANAAYAPTVFYVVMFAIHLLEGSHFVKGGVSVLADALAGAIRANGGEVLTRRRVNAVEVAHGRARGVTTENGEQYEADTIVSNISPYTLHSQLISEAPRKALWARRLSNLRPSVSCVAAYLGVKPEVWSMLPDNISFWFKSMDPEHHYGERLFTSADDLDHLVLLTTREEGIAPTVTLMQFTQSGCSSDWKADKIRAAEAMITRANQLYPGLRDLVEVTDVGSPTTFERYTGNIEGALYGFENSRDMYAEAKLPIKTYLPNLYQTGHWGKPGGGVWNVMVNGYTASKIIERDAATRHAPSRSTSGRKPVSVRMIYPKFQKFLSGHDELRPLVEKHLVGEYTMPPSLALPILAALTPSDVEVRLTDDNIGQAVDFDEKVDAVVLSCFTPQASRAYQLADEYRKRGTKVLLGGLHPTCRPEEAMEHADAVCVGEGEDVWPRMLEDLRAGTLKRRYEPTEPYSLERFPVPKREIFKRENYQWSAHLILVTRGCPVRCGGCPIPVKEGTTLRFRPIDRVVADILSMPYREFYITDDTIMLPGKRNMKYLLELMDRTRELDVSMFLASTMMMVPDPEFYRKLAKGGATSMYTVTGFDRASRRLFSADCTSEEWQAGIDLVKMNEDAGIRFFASIGLGFDDQDEGVFDRVGRFLHDAKVDLAEFYITTPFPSTPFGVQCEAEGRILHRDYNKWNTGNVVFKPRLMSPQRLLDGYYGLWKEFYRNKQPTRTLESFQEINEPRVGRQLGHGGGLAPVVTTPAAPVTPPAKAGRALKIKFVYPRFEKFLETYPELAEFPAIAATWSFRMPPALGIPILINMLPPDVSWHVQDQNIEPITYDDDSDIVAISYFTPQAAYAYEVGDNFLRRGKTVIMGGMHPSMMPDEAGLHCTSVCVGEAESVFAQQIADFRAGKLKPRYKAEHPPEPHMIVKPRSGVFAVADKYDWHAGLVSITRGCPFQCEWCNIPLYQGSDIRLRPMDEVVADIAELAGQEFYITDDMVMLNRPKTQKYMVELCERIEQYKVNMFLSCSPAMNNDEKFLDALARGGARSMYTVFASDPMSARFYSRHPGVWERTLDLVKRLEDRGIRFFGSFGVGFDCAGEDQFDLILEFCHKANVKTAEFFIATPFPGTPFWTQVESEGRFLLPRDWRKYNCANVVFRPRNLTEQQLRDGFVRLWKEFFKTANHEEALASFRQKAENILRSREYSQRVKDAVSRGLARHPGPAAAV